MRMPVDHTAHTTRLEAEVRELNDYLHSQDIQGGKFHGYLRIFQNGNEPGFNWNQRRQAIRSARPQLLPAALEGDAFANVHQW